MSSLQSAQSIDNNCFEASYLLGVIYDRARLKHHAIDNFTNAIELSPMHISALYHRGVIYYEQGKISQAIEDFDRAKSIQDCGLEERIERDETSFYAEGMALYYTERFDLAHTILNLGILAAKRYNNPNFRKELMQLLKKLPPV